uniref:Myophilin-like protein n=1 Tax=Halisarca dujardinii TaxID=2583056 RepID=A0AA96MKE2_HALDU|nr:myophilin-like protein [Halisarca dujardinii]
MANRPEGFGMTAELNKKIAEEWKDMVKRNEVAKVVDWIEAISAESAAKKDLNPREKDCDFHEWLKDGTVLCKLINVIKPGSVKKVNTSKMAFIQMENIGNFLSSCQAFGVPKEDLFQTVSLFERTNLPQVITGINALGRKTGVNRPDLPRLGPKEAQENKREFSEEVLREGQTALPLASSGSNKGASQSGMSFGNQRQIN